MPRLAHPVSAALFMIAAGALYSAVNFLTAFATGNPEWGCVTSSGQSCLAFDARSYTFYQYGIALLCTIPFIMGKGSLRALRTNMMPLHLIRVALAVIGVELWVAGFSSGVPLWTMVALLMTSPLFVIAGSALLLKEKVGPVRWMATLVGFFGASIVLEPWHDFDSRLLFPIAASIAWAFSSLCVKRLSSQDSAETITLWLLILFTPLALAATWVYPDLSGLGDHLWGIGEGLVIPHQTPLIALLAVAGFMTALAQLCLALSYKLGDASYVQPFDHIKLAFNILLSWWLFNDVPQGVIWLGVLLILTSSLFIAWREHQPRRAEVST